MAIGYGSVSMSTINSELGRSSTAGISLDSAENGSYVCINQFSGARPSSSNPASMSEWKGYDHGYRPGASYTYGYDYYYTYCADSYGTMAVVRAIVDYAYNVPNDPCYGSYYSYYYYSYAYVSYYYYDSGCNTSNPCLKAGTKITMADGSLKNVEDLVVGDIVFSADIAELPKEKAGYSTLEIVKNWTKEDVSDYQYSTANVVAVEAVEVPQFFSINLGLLEMSADHISLYKDVIDGLWKLGTTLTLKVGDQLIDINKNIITIDSISIINTPTFVYKIDVENLDLFFANGVLTHNVKQQI